MMEIIAWSGITIGTLLIVFFCMAPIPNITVLDRMVGRFKNY